MAENGGSAFRAILMLAVAGASTLLLAAIAINWWATNQTVPLSYTLVADFTQMPPDDRTLEQWVLNQPGIHANSVMIERVDGQLIMSFTLLQNMKARPGLPDLNSECKELGYVGSEFRDTIRGREAEARRRGIIE